MNHSFLINSSSPRILLEFNKLAVSLLEQGKSKEAIHQFSLGLKKACSGEEDGTNSTNLFKSSFEYEDAELLHGEDVLQATTLPPVECDEGNHSNFFTLFDQALSYDDSNLSSSETEQSVDISLVAPVYLFNIGLAFHRQGIATGISTHFQDALRFYHLAKESSLDQNTHSSNQDYQLVMFAIQNNMGHIFARFFDRENARICYNLIVHLAPNMSQALAGNEAFLAMLYNLIFSQEMFQFAPAA